MLYIGSKGKMYHSSHGGMPAASAARAPRRGGQGTEVHETLARPLRGVGRGLQGRAAPVSNFDYAGPLTETALLGVLSLRAPGRRLEWDSENLRVKNAPELSRYIHTEYRKGWTL